MPMTTFLALDENAAILIVAIGVIGAVFYIIKTVKDVKQTREREQTKREIAAYVAEGTIRPDDAAKILNAGGGAPQSSEAEQQIASAVAWGTIKPEKAEGLLRTLRTPPNPDGGVKA
jgi:Tfp pilus assembly protein PilV